MTVAVVITTAGRDRHLERTLAGLAAQRDPADEIVVVDMGDTGVGMVPPVRRVALPVTGSALPLAAARNAGAAATTSDQLVFLDVDCIPHPDLVGDHVRALSAAPPAIACGRVRYLREGWDDERQGGLDACSAPHPVRPCPDETTADHDHPELLWSLNIAVDRPTWDRLGGFDTGYRGYGAEDTDLGLRAGALGIPLLWVAGALAYHQWHPASRLDPARTGEIVANARRFRDRWQHWPMRGWLEELAAIGAVRFDPAADVLEEVPSWTPSRAS